MDDEQKVSDVLNSFYPHSYSLAALTQNNAQKEKQ